MMKTIRMTLCLVLAALLLAGCAAPPTLAGVIEQPKEEREGMLPIRPFEEMAYSRPSVTALRLKVLAVELALKTHAPYKIVEAALDACYEAYYRFDTMSSLAYIRNSQDMRDSFYAAENTWCDEKSATVNMLMEKMYYACGMSPMAEELEEKYFWEGFAEEYADDSNATYDEEMVALMEQEAGLMAEYRSLVASPTIVWKGEEVDYYSLLEEVGGFDYWNAFLLYYETYNEPVADVYIRLVKVRQAMAEHLGYDSYEQMQFDYYFERDYTPEQAAQYVADIKTWLVPLYEELSAGGDLYDNGDDALAEDRLYDILAAGVQSMGGQVQETFDYMSRYHLYDISFSNYKADMSFQTYLSDYEAPFLFMDPEGSLSDVTTFSHEFGHCLDAYVNYNAGETIDLAETYSQAMEFLMLDRLDGELSQHEIDTLRRIKLVDTLAMYVQQASFAEFEREVYAADPDSLTPDFLNKLSLRVAKDYGYYESWSEQYYAMSWIDIVHYFEVPFYVITYPVSNDVAMQIYELELEREGAGLEKYLEILPREYEGIIDTAVNGGLQSPFAPGRVRDVTVLLRELLGARALDAAA